MNAQEFKHIRTDILKVKQSELANMLNITREHVTRLETGRAAIRKTVALAMMQLCNDLRDKTHGQNPDI